MLSKLRFFLFAATISLLFASCQQNNNNAPISSCSYSAYGTDGSEFVYTTTNNNGTDTITETVIGDTIIDSYNCKIVKRVARNSTPSTIYLYLYCGPSGYMHRDFFVPGYNVTVDSMVYLKDNLSPGDMWSNTFTGTFNNFTVTVEYENFYETTQTTRVVNGQTFNNVIQIRTDLYTTIAGFGGRQLVGSYNYYFGEGVGLIETDLQNTKILSYTIVP